MVKKQDLFFIFCLTFFIQTKTTTPAISSVEKKLSEHGLILPHATPPIANYIPFVRTGNLIFVSGTLPIENGKIKYTGHLGSTVSVSEGQEAAKLCILNILANLKSAVGNLDKVKKCVKITVLVNASPAFTEHPEVANGASNFLVDILGQEKGTHTRAAFGAASLPRNAAVEIEAQFEVEA